MRNDIWHRPGSAPWRAVRDSLKAQRRRVLEFLIRQPGATRIRVVAERLRIPNIATVLDHWWFRHRGGAVWLSVDGVRELAGTQIRAYEVEETVQ